MQLIDGRKLAARIRADVKTTVATLPAKPGLAIVLVGDDPASHTYVRLKAKAAEDIGLHFARYDFPATATEAEITERIQALNTDPAIHGIVVQLPLPAPLNPDRIVNTIAPSKDADGFLRANLDRFRTDASALPPALCEGIWRLIASTGVTPSRAAVLANSTTFGEPMAGLLTRKKFDVQISYPPFHNVAALTRAADVIVVAVGRAKFLTAENVKSGAVIIDVGFNHVGDKTVGDADAESLQNLPGWLTPVPGGVGPVTVVMLLKRTVELLYRHGDH